MENEGLKKQIEKMKKRIAQPSDKVKSMDDLKRELKAFFSFKGYSELLDTDDWLKKAFWLFSVVILSSICVYMLYMNFAQYYQYNVVTQIHIVENETLTFPTVTFCFQQYIYSMDMNRTPILIEHFIPRNLSDVIVQCNFEDTDCSIDDFENFLIYYQFGTIDLNLNCYKFNGGRNGSNHEVDILKSTQFGAYSGLTLQLNMLKRDHLFYYVGDNKIRPIYTELTHSIQPGKNILVEMKKVVEKKLPEPYSRCQTKINSETSRLVKQVLAQNITYRQLNCYDLCLLEYASARNISRQFAYLSLRFNYQGNCSQLCPLECDSNLFELSEDIYHYIEENNNYLWFNIFYSQNKYTEISQAAETTVADLISNNGGVLGLFVELSLIVITRWIMKLIF